MNEAERQIHRSIEVKLALLAEGGADVVEQIARLMVEALKSGHRFYVFGNGGSAADAQHIAGELVGRFMMERRALPGQAFTTDTSVMTAIANDYGFDECFVRQVEGFVQPGDVVMAISTSGNSPNVVKAAIRAKALGAKVVGLSGRGGGKLREISDICLVVPADESPRIQESHITAGHIICDLVERGVFGG
jgi:D-sedoheptulose 7-phosphate isomerase